MAVSSQRSRRHRGVEPGGAGSQVGGGGLAAGDFVGEDELEELGVSHAAGVGEGEAFGEGVEAAAELDPAQQRLELGSDRRGGHRAALERGRESGLHDRFWGP